MRMRHSLSLLTFVVACAACTDRGTTPPTSTVPVTSATIATPATPATMPAPATPAAPSTTPMPPSAITFDGFGPAHWGASEEQLRQAWGKDLDGAPSEPGACHYLFPHPRSAGGYRVAFMIEGATFGRIDVRAPDIAAPGGGRVGMDKAELRRLYPDIAEQKHKYIEGGLNLRGMDPKGGQGVIVFEVDPAGKATAWRIGVPPQVDYVEGCS
jgi:hypothetical protein